MFDFHGSLTYIGSIVTKAADSASGWGIASAVANIVMSGATIGALVVAIRAWTNTKRAEWREVIGRYFKEYRGLEMGRAVDELHRFYRDNKSNPVNVIRTYINHALASDDFHLVTRRRVSAFYQELGALVSTSPQMEKIVYSLWRKADFDIIVMILLPIEAIANKWAIAERNAWVELTEEEKEAQIREDVRRNMRKVWPVKKGKVDRSGRPVDIIVQDDGWDQVKLNMYRLWDRASPKSQDYFRDVTESETKSEWWTYQHGAQS